MKKGPERGLNVIRFGAAGLVQLFAYVVGVVALIGAMWAAVHMVDVPMIFIAIGLIASAVATIIVSWIPAHLLRRPLKWRYAALQGIGIALVLWLGLSAVFLRPLVPKANQFVAVIPAGVELWNLSTGSTVAVRKVAAANSSPRPPIIVVHGGPGAYSVALDQTVDALSQLSAEGHDVYFYDQIGGGLSHRLDDIGEYSLDRHISDLRAVFEHIGEEQVVLIGSSWGTTLASNYVSRYPSHVSSAVFSSTAPIYHPDWRDEGYGSLDDSMTVEQKAVFDNAVGRPRLIAAIVLSDINPQAASRFLPSQEAGSFFDDIANEFYLGFTVCDADAVRTQTEGYGLWSNRMTGRTLDHPNDPKPVLRQNQLPVLVIRGECDYLKEAVAREYVSVFPNASYVSIEDAGHMIYWENPDAYLGAVREFLNTQYDSSESAASRHALGEPASVREVSASAL